MSSETYDRLRGNFFSLLEIFSRYRKGRFKSGEDLFEDISLGLQILYNPYTNNTKEDKVFFKTVYFSIKESIADSDEISYATVKELKNIFKVLYSKLQEVAIKPEDFSVQIYKYSRDSEYTLDDASEQLSFLTKLIPNSSIETKKTKMGERIYLTVKTPVEEKKSSGLNITEYFKKRKERKKKVKAFESVLEKAVAVKRINKFLTRVGEGIISRRPFDSLVFY